MASQGGMLAVMTRHMNQHQHPGALRSVVMEGSHTPMSLDISPSRHQFALRQ